LKVVPFSLRQLNLPEHKHEVEVHPEGVDPKRHHDGARGDRFIANKPHSINFLNKEMADLRSRMLWSASRRSFRFRGSVWSFERLNDSGNARADPSISSPRYEHRIQQAASKNTSPRTARVRPEITFLGSDQQQISYPGLPTRIFEKSETLWQYLVRSARVARGALLIGPAGSILNQRSSRNIQRHRFLGVFGRN